MFTGPGSRCVYGLRVLRVRRELSRQPPRRLTRLARRFPVLGLSNASRATLLRLNAYAGLRWHQALSAEDARAHKPAPEVYQLAIDAAGCPPERVLKVAAHAWDLRGAQTVGMRTAYVQRPVGDPPKRTDTGIVRPPGGCASPH